VANDGDLRRNLLKIWMLRRCHRLPRSKESASDGVLGNIEIRKKSSAQCDFASRKGFLRPYPLKALVKQKPKTGVSPCQQSCSRNP
jgi:hypothetical protein